MNTRFQNAALIFAISMSMSSVVGCVNRAFAQSPTSTPVVICLANQGTPDTTNTVATEIIVRNLTSESNAFSISRVVIYDANGNILFSGLPAGLGSDLPAHGLQMIAVSSLVPAGSGTLTATVRLNVYSSGTTPFWIVANSALTDSSGDVIGRDTTVCLNGAPK